MSSERYIVFPHQLLGGLTNMLMEIEIRVILAMANRTLVSLNNFHVHLRMRITFWTLQRSSNAGSV